MHRRQTAHTCERTRAGRACEGHGETTGRRERSSAHTRPSANPNQGVQAWRVDGASGRTWQCLPRYSKLHQEERQRTCPLMATMATMATPKLKLEKKNEERSRRG